MSRHLLSAAALPAMTSSAFAVDFVFSTGTFVPGMTAPKPPVAGQVLQINAGGNKFFNEDTFTNQSGLVNWNADALHLQNGAAFANKGTLALTRNAAMVFNGGAAAGFVNTGMIIKTGSAGTSTPASRPAAS